MTEKDFGSQNTWYDLWAKQSKEFFESAESNLQAIFGKDSFANPEAHLQQINDWLTAVKKQWQFSQLSEKQKDYQSYIDLMNKMYNDAAKMMMEQWIQRSHEENPVKNIRELYELWLNCCQEVYKKALSKKDYQEAYAEFMNSALKFWQSNMPK